MAVGCQPVLMIISGLRCNRIYYKSGNSLFVEYCSDSDIYNTRFILKRRSVVQVKLPQLFSITAITIQGGPSGYSRYFRLYYKDPALSCLQNPRANSEDERVMLLLLLLPYRGVSRHFHMWANPISAQILCNKAIK